MRHEVSFRLIPLGHVYNQWQDFISIWQTLDAKRSCADVVQCLALMQSPFLGHSMSLLHLLYCHLDSLLAFGLTDFMGYQISALSCWPRLDISLTRNLAYSTGYTSALPLVSVPSGESRERFSLSVPSVTAGNCRKVSHKTTCSFT